MYRIIRALLEAGGIEPPRPRKMRAFCPERNPEVRRAFPRGYTARRALQRQLQPPVRQRAHERFSSALSTPRAATLATNKRPCTELSRSAARRLASDAFALGLHMLWELGASGLAIPALVLLGSYVPADEKRGELAALGFALKRHIERCLTTAGQRPPPHNDARRYCHCTAGLGGVRGRKVQTWSRAAA